MNAKALKQKGFTLIELLVVVVIIGILASVAVPNFMGAQDKAKNSGVQANTHNVQMALEQYAVDNAGVYPADSAALKTGVIDDKGYMAGGVFPKTPWGSQQAAGIPMTVLIATVADGSASVAVGKSIGAGTNPVAPTTELHYGAISYMIPTSATAKERYCLAGSGKRNNDASLAILLKNF